jgi:hypothetical protein
MERTGMRILSLRRKHPFWPVTIISGIITFLSFIMLPFFYWQTGQWQYVPLSGLVGLMALAHVIAWWRVYYHQQIALGIWLIMVAKIGGSAFIPLFVADYWLIGLLVLVIVSL